MGMDSLVAALVLSFEILTKIDLLFYTNIVYYYNTQGKSLELITTSFCNALISYHQQIFLNCQISHLAKYLYFLSVYRIIFNIMCKNKPYSYILNNLTRLKKLFVLMCHLCLKYKNSWWSLYKTLYFISKYRRGLCHFFHLHYKHTIALLSNKYFV